ncbi:CHAT domain-containing protein [Mycena sp. CBHHK59/15]|nr:CHAT domain-containing protein [Mycena sp. CBHHK59/15]
MAIDLLPQLAALRLDVTSRKEILTAVQGGFGSDAAICAISLGKYEVAVELLEAARSVFWSQALYLRSPLDKLGHANPTLASKLLQLSQALEQASFRDTKRNLAADTYKRVISIEAEGARCRLLNQEWDEVVNSVRMLPEFRDFMRPKSIVALQRAAMHGPIVALIAGIASCHALVIKFSGNVKCIPLAEGTTWDTINSLAQLKSGYPTRLWWCPTGPFVFLPMHAAGIYGTNTESLTDYVVSSYIPALKALLAPTSEAPSSPDPFKMTAIIQPTTPGYPPLRWTVDELHAIREKIPNEWLTSFGTSEASVDGILPHLLTSVIVHFACHGTQDPLDPLDSALLIGHDRLKVSQIMEKSGGLVFLSACETVMGDKQLPDEAMHLAASLLFAGFRSAVATMCKMVWAISLLVFTIFRTMSDPDGPAIAKEFYGYIFRNTDAGLDPPVLPDLSESARALHLAVAKAAPKSSICSVGTLCPFQVLMCKNKSGCPFLP